MKRRKIDSFLNLFKKVIKPGFDAIQEHRSLIRGSLHYLRLPHLIFIISVVFYCFFLLPDKVLVNTDFMSYYTAGNLVFQGKAKDLYHLKIQSDFQNKYFDTHHGFPVFKNPPTLALLFTPLALLSIENAYKVYVLINIVISVLIANFLVNSLSLNQKYQLIGKFIFFAFIPLLLSIVVGQVSVFLLLIAIFIYKFLRKGKFFYLGLLSGLFFNKPQFLILVPFILVLSSKKQNFLLGLILSFFIQLVTSIALVGSRAILFYPQFIMLTETTFYGSAVFSQIGLTSALYLLNNFLGFSKTFPMIVNLLIYFAIFVLFVTNYQEKNLGGSLSVALLFTLALAPHVWDYDLTLTLIPIFYLLKSYQITRDASQRIKIISILILLYFSWTLRLFTHPFLISFILLFVGAILLLDQELKLESV